MADAAGRVFDALCGVDVSLAESGAPVSDQFAAEIEDWLSLTVKSPDPSPLAGRVDGEAGRVGQASS
jgi:hypothetical protein